MFLSFPSGTPCSMLSFSSPIPRFVGLSIISALFTPLLPTQYVWDLWLKSRLPVDTWLLFLPMPYLHLTLRIFESARSDSSFCMYFSQEKHIYDLKKKNQELEKFKFVLDHRIEQFKKQIESRENDIKIMQKQIHEVSNTIIRPLLLNPLAEHEDHQARLMEVPLFVPWLLSKMHNIDSTALQLGKILPCNRYFILYHMVPVTDTAKFLLQCFIQDWVIERLLKNLILIWLPCIYLVEFARCCLCWSGGRRRELFSESCRFIQRKPNLRIRFIN